MPGASFSLPERKSMTIRQRLSLLLLLVSAGCIAGIVAFHVNEEHKIAELAASERANAELIFDRISQLRAESLGIFIGEYSRWDEMVDYLADADPEWARVNLSEGPETFGLDGLWILRSDFSQLFAVGPVTAMPQDTLGLFREQLAGLFDRDPMSSFFVRSARGILEVRGATIVPSADIRHETEARGFLIAARRWDQKRLDELASLTGLSLDWVEADASSSPSGTRHPDQTTVQFTRSFPGWDTRPVAALRAHSESAILGALAENSRFERLLIVAVPLVFLASLWFALRVWVTRPLGTVIGALRGGGASSLGALATQRTELGEVAALVERSFAQRVRLEEELLERRRIEMELLTARERLEERVRERTAEIAAVNETLVLSEERLRIAVDAADLGLWDLNLNTGEAVINGRYATMLGFAPGGLHETNAAWIERLHPDDRDRVSGVYRDYLGGKIPSYKVEFRQRTPAGEWKWLLSVGSVVARGTGGEPLRMVGIHFDIDERKRAEAELGAVLAKLQEQEEVIRRSTITIWQARNEPGWPLELLSENIAKLGYPAEDFLSGRMSFAELVHPEDLPTIIRAAERAASEGASDYAIDYRVRTKAGEVRWLSDRAWLDRDAGGRVLRFQGVSVDITDLKRATEELQASEVRYRELAAVNAQLLMKAREEAATRRALLAEVNHRVKNNLLQVRRLIELEGQSQEREGERPARGLSDLAARIGGLVAVHRMLSNAEWNPLQLGELVQEIVRGALSSSPNRQRIGLQVVGSGSTLRVPSEQATALGMILNELATNSAKHAFGAQQDGRIEVEIEAEGAIGEAERPLVTLRFRDDGPGYPAEVLTGGRDGVGLHLVRGRVRSPLHGEISLATERGALATIRFRRARLVV